MNIEEIKAEGILKEEKIGYLKSSLNLLQGNIYLTPRRLAVHAHKTGVGGMGLLGALLKKKVESKEMGFEFLLSQIKAVGKGSHGANKNVLEISGKDDSTQRVMVAKVQDWLDILNDKIWK